MLSLYSCPVKLITTQSQYTHLPFKLSKIEHILFYFCKPTKTENKANSSFLSTRVLWIGNPPWMLSSQLSELLHGLRLSRVDAGLKYILQNLAKTSGMEIEKGMTSGVLPAVRSKAEPGLASLAHSDCLRLREEVAASCRLLLPDREHRSAEGSCGRPLGASRPGSAAQLRAWPLMQSLLLFLFLFKALEFFLQMKLMKMVVA